MGLKDRLETAIDIGDLDGAKRILNNAEDYEWASQAKLPIPGYTRQDLVDICDSETLVSALDDDDIFHLNDTVMDAIITELLEIKGEKGL